MILIFNNQNKINMKKVLLLMIIAVSLSLSSCSENRENDEAEQAKFEEAAAALEEAVAALDSENQTSTASVSSKLGAFNDIGNLRSSLSKNGIGPLGQWKSDMMGGYMSITDYYQFGSGVPQSNIAYYIESEHIGYAESLKISMNISSSGDKKEGVKLFSSVLAKTLKSVNITPTQSIIQKIIRGEAANFSHKDYSIEFKVDKGNAENWILKITGNNL